MPFQKGNKIRAGAKLTEETKNKIRLKHTGMKMPPRTEEHRRKLSEINKGREITWGDKISKTKKGTPSPRKGIKLSDQTKEKLRLANIGKKLLEETKLKISQTTKGRKQTKEHIQKRSERLKGRTGKVGSTNPNWRGGKSFELYGFNWTNLLKHSIRTRDCFRCVVCLKNGWVVHHIDYNKKNCNPDNLITLCDSCHGKTNFNREKWINFFRKYDRKKT